MQENYLRLKKTILRKLEDELDQSFHYHNVNHTLDVLNAAELLNNPDGTDSLLTKAQLKLLLTAALLHDIGFLKSYTNNEQFACEYVRSELPEFAYSTTQIEQICQMIMATALPQSPQNLSGKILCDADLFYLGTDKYEGNAKNLREEMALHGMTYSDREWLELQINFLNTHSYFTETAIKLLEPQKASHLARLKYLYNQKYQEKKKE